MKDLVGQILTEILCQSVQEKELGYEQYSNFQSSWNKLPKELVEQIKYSIEKELNHRGIKYE